MVSGKKGRRIIPSELLEMLDLEERQALASEIGLMPPKNLNDQVFANSIAEFSATTLLQIIVRLRSPIIEMLKDVYQFLEEEEIRGRTTIRAVVLPGAKDDLQVLFNPAMKEAIGHHTEFCVMAHSRIPLIPGLERIESFGKGSFYTKLGMVSDKKEMLVP